jgi:hypothetical protein
LVEVDEAIRSSFLGYSASATSGHRPSEQDTTSFASTT